jgi:hypothetical protein
MTNNRPLGVANGVLWVFVRLFPARAANERGNRMTN